MNPAMEAIVPEGARAAPEDDDTDDDMPEAFFISSCAQDGVAAHGSFQYKPSNPTHTPSWHWARRSQIFSPGVGIR